MAANSETQTFLDEVAAAGGKPWHEMTAAEARETWYSICYLFAGTPEDVESIDDQIIPGPDGDLELRTYTPEGADPYGALVYFHGGGWVVGTTDTYQVPCRALANATGCKVFAPTYRMAPEYRYPAAAEDCYATFTWITANADRLGVDPAKIVVGGDSAGGNLAAAVSLMARDRGGAPPAFQLLIYPVTDHDLERASYHKYADGYVLEREAMRWFWDHYVPDVATRDEPYASPLRAQDLNGLAPAHVITAECDVLCDEGEAYAARLEADGVEVTLSRHEGTIHGFMHPFAGRLSDGAAGLADAASAVRTALA